LFLGNNFLTTNVSKAIKGSKDAEYRLVFSKERNEKLPFAVQAQARWRHPKNSNPTPNMP